METVRRPTPMESALGLTAVKTDAPPIHREMPAEFDVSSMQGEVPPQDVVGVQDQFERGANPDHYPSQNDGVKVPGEVTSQTQDNADVHQTEAPPEANFGGKFPPEHETDLLHADPQGKPPVVGDTEVVHQP
jgi:hypothetical protein